MIWLGLMSWGSVGSFCEQSPRNSLLGGLFSRFILLCIHYLVLYTEDHFAEFRMQSHNLVFVPFCEFLVGERTPDLTTIKGNGFYKCIRGPGNWTFFGTPLFLSYWDLLSEPRSDRICAEDLGAVVGPPWLGTETPEHQQTVDIWLQILVGWGRVLQTVLVPLPMRWYICWRGCLTPCQCGKKYVSTKHDKTLSLFCFI